MVRYGTAKIIRANVKHNGYVANAKEVPIRVAIRQMLRKAYIYKEVGDRHGYYAACNWLKRFLKQRNTGMKIYLKG